LPLEFRHIDRFDWCCRQGRVREGLARAKQAHNDLISVIHRTQASALQIEAMAKLRLADEYDAAQERGEVAGQGKPSRAEGLPTTEILGLTHKDIHEARLVRDAEQNDPGVIGSTLEELLDAGHEPTKAAVREAVVAAALRGLSGKR
jgi:hypothetical protein